MKHRSSFPGIIIGIIAVLLVLGSAAAVFAARNSQRGWGFGFPTNIMKGGSNMNFGIGTKYDVNESKKADPGSTTRIEIITVSADTILANSTSGDVEATLAGQVRTTEPRAVPSLEMRQSGDVLIIEEVKEATILAGFYSSNLTLNISIPESFTGEVTFKSASGNFTASGRRFRNLDLKLVSGDLSLQNIVLDENLKISSVSGDIKSEELSVAGNLEILTVSGNAGLVKVDCGQFNLTDTSGDVRITGCKTETFSAVSISGDIVLKESEGALKLKTTSGDIKADGFVPKGEVGISSVSGEINLLFPGDTGFSLDAGSTSGDIDCGFALNNRTGGKRNLSGTAGTGKIPVKIKTTSGDISVDKSF